MAIWMPETRGRSLEEIQEGFERLTMKNVSEVGGNERKRGMRLRRLLKGPTLVASDRRANLGGLVSGSELGGVSPMRVELSSV
jgi:hypothetical protein